MASGFFNKLLQKNQAGSTLKCYSFQTANIQSVYHKIQNDIKQEIPHLQWMETAEGCDIILVLCPIISRAGTDIEVAKKKMDDLLVSKPAVLVVLHNTLDKDAVVPDSSRSTDVKRKNTLVVDCLWNDEEGLLLCKKNKDSLASIISFMNPQIIQSPKLAKQKHQINCFIIVTGKTFNTEKSFVSALQNQIPGLQLANAVQEADVIFVFSPVVTLPETSIKAAMELLNSVSDTKPAALVLLYHTFDPKYKMRDGSDFVSRDNLIIVNALFHEDQGLLECPKNDESLKEITNFTKQFKQNPEKLLNNKIITTDNSLNSAVKTHKCCITSTKNEQKGFSLIIKDLMKEIKDLQVEDNPNHCDFMLNLYPAEFQAGNNIESAIQIHNNMPVSKPTVVVVLHYTSDANFVTQSSEAVLAVDCLYHEDGLLQCNKNKASLKQISHFIKQQVFQLNNEKQVTHQCENINQGDTSQQRTGPLTVNIFLNENQRSKIDSDRVTELPKNVHGKKNKNDWDQIKKHLIKFCDENQEREQEIENKNQQLTERENAIEEKTNEVKKREQEIEYKNQLVTERENSVEEKNNKVIKREQEIKDKNKQVMEREKEIEKKNQLVMEREIVIEEKNNKVMKREQEVENKNKLVMEREEEIEKKNNQLMGREKEIEKKNIQLMKREKEMENKNNLLMDKEKEMEKKNNLLMELEKEMEKKKQSTD